MCSESRGGRSGLPSPKVLMVSVDVKSDIDLEQSESTGFLKAKLSTMERGHHVGGWVTVTY